MSSPSEMRVTKLSEINLPADEHHTFTCILSSMNAALYDEWKDTDAVFVATVFLDCVASEFITRAKGIHGLEKAVRFTEKARALGLGTTGFSTYLQKKRIPFESLEAMYFNQELFEKLDNESLEASVWMGEQWGCPEWVREYCESYGGPGVRNCSRLAVAPTKSTALIMGGISEGINPDPGGVYTQLTAAGEVSRVTPVLLELMKELAATAPMIVIQCLDLVVEALDVPKRDEIVKRIRRTTGVADPDEDPNNPSPETQAQAAFLQSRGCTEAQGFLYGRPMPAEAFERFVRDASRD